jgi:hypothetical protein
MKNEHQLKMGSAIMTGEYIGGLLAGVGIGILITYAFLLSSHRIPNRWAFVLGMGFMIAGSFLAAACQRRKSQKNSCDDKRDA